MRGPGISSGPPSGSSGSNNNHGAPQQLRPNQSGPGGRQYGGDGGSSQGAPAPAPAPVLQTASGNEHFIPIRALNMYQNKWVIKARITGKSDMRTWDKGPNNQGQLFSVTLCDQDGEIRATFFREAALTWHEALQDGEVYTFSNGKLKLANKQFNDTNNDHEITFGPEVQIKHVPNDRSIKALNMNTTDIKEVNNKAPNMMVDIMGIATEVGEVQEFTSKAGKPLTKCEVTMLDKSQTSIRVTLWGEKARDFAVKMQGLANPVVALKNCRISDWGGRTLGTGGSSQIVIDPDMPQTAELRQWFDAGGAAGQVQSLSSSGGGGGANTPPKPAAERHILAALKQLGLGKGEKRDYVDIKARIGFINSEKMWYEACPEEGNNKKVVKDASDSYFCEATGKHYNTKQNRYILRARIADWSDSSYVTIFDDVAKALFGGVTADEMELMKDNEEAKFAQVLDAALFNEYSARLAVKEEEYGGEQRLKCSVMDFKPVDYVAEANGLIEAIAKYT